MHEPVIPFEVPTYGEELKGLTDELRKTNELLGELAGHANDTLKFFRKYVPWAIAALAVVYPSVAKLINGLPPLPH